MDADQLIEAAQQATGLTEFDSGSFREGLELVTSNLRNSPTLTEAGRQMLAGISVACLSNRLHVADYARRHPEITSRPVERPVFILGAPRTGTTLVSNLLAQDPSRRSLLRWEGLASVPPPTQETLYTDPRCLAMKAADSAALSSASEIHHEAADTPTECVIVHAQDFKSMLYDTAVRDPAYAEWVLQVDATSTYAYHKLQLQVLQAHTQGTWALKAPSHALFIDALRKVYPDARIVWTHRDPYTAYGSLCSLIHQFRSQYEPVDRAAIGAENIRQFKAHIDRPAALERREGSGSVHHLHYARMARDPLGEMRRLYDWLGDPLTPATEARMAAWLADNPQGKFGAHRYRLADFDLSPAALRPHFQDYVEAYGVALDAEAA